MTWAINVLAPFLLASLLQDAVTGRIVNVSSISAGRDLDWGNLNQVGPSGHNLSPLSRMSAARAGQVRVSPF